MAWDTVVCQLCERDNGLSVSIKGGLCFWAVGLRLLALVEIFCSMDVFSCSANLTLFSSNLRIVFK
jgi:hypothetical protein